MIYDKINKCLICGGDNIYSGNAASMQCMFCGESYYTNIVCEYGHFICGDCHLERALEMITSICEKSNKREAINIAYELLMNKWIKMHGTEHPYIVAAVLLTAYKNRGYGGKIPGKVFQAYLNEAKNRAMKIPPGSCGYWGCCGEAIGAGIFASIALKPTPMSVRERGFANMITSKVLEEIAVYGGPRCSKRETFIAILTTSKYTEEQLGMTLTDFEGIECIFYERNPDCQAAKCPFHPDNNEAIPDTDQPL